MTSPRYDKALEDESSIDARIDMVENTFAAAAAYSEAHAQGKLKHPTKAGVTAVEVMPVLPDVSRWGLNLVHAAFDEPPLQELRGQAARDGAEIDKDGMPLIQGLQSAHEQWMAYLMPLKRKTAVGEGEQELQEDTTEYRRLRSYTFEKIEESKGRKESTLLLQDPNEPGVMLYKNLANFFKLHKVAPPSSHPAQMY